MPVFKFLIIDNFCHKSYAFYYKWLTKQISCLQCCSISRAQVSTFYILGILGLYIILYTSSTSDQLHLKCKTKLFNLFTSENQKWKRTNAWDMMTMDDLWLIYWLNLYFGFLSISSFLRLLTNDFKNRVDIYYMHLRMRLHTYHVTYIPTIHAILSKRSPYSHLRMRHYLQIDNNNNNNNNFISIRMLYQYQV